LFVFVALSLGYWFINPPQKNDDKNPYEAWAWLGYSALILASVILFLFSK